jgi:hypothetical protein
MSVTPSAPPDQSVSTSDRVSLAALVLGTGAFFIAFQFLYQYIASGTREKCLSGRIGECGKYTTSRWDVYRWRFRVRYPEVELEVLNALAARKEVLVHNHRPQSLKRIERYIAQSGEPGISWIDISFHKRREVSQRVKEPALHLKFLHVWHGTAMLMQNRKPVSVFSLPVNCRFEWFWF